MLPPDIFPEQWTGTPRTVLGSRSRGSGRRERTAGAAATAAHCALPQPVFRHARVPRPLLNPHPNLLREHGAWPAGSVGAAAATPAVASWMCSAVTRASIDGVPRPPGGCAPCRPARPSLATRARALGLERRRRAAGRPRPHPRPNAERRALRLTAHQTARPGGAAAHTPTRTLAMYLVRRER